MPSRRSVLRSIGATATAIGTAGCSSLGTRWPDAVTWHTAVGDPMPTEGSPVPAPVVADGVVVSIGGRSEEAGGRVDAIDANRGERRWSTSIGQPGGLAISGDAVYVGVTTGDHRGRVLAFDVSTGAKQWQSPVGNAASMLAAADGRVYAADGSLTALDASNGAVLWDIESRNGLDFGGQSRSDYALVATRQQVLYGDRAGVISLDPATGRSHWRWRPPADGWNTPEVTLSTTDELVLVGGEFPQTAVALARATGTTQWTTSFGADASVSGFHTHGGGILVATGTGTGRSNGFGTVFVLGDAGTEYQEARFAAPVVDAAGVTGLFVVTTSEGTVTGIDAGSVQHERWRAPIDAAVVATDGNRGFAQTQDGTLLALAAS